MLSVTDLFACTMGCFNSKEPVPEPQPEQQSTWDGHIRPVKPWKVEPSLTTEQLTRLRNEFWETRVEGRKEMWEALRFAAEASTVRFYMACKSLHIFSIQVRYSYSNYSIRAFD